jgi:methylated-DNA-[protein]-cysteine S-methyltransferase
MFGISHIRFALRSLTIGDEVSRAVPPGPTCRLHRYVSSATDPDRGRDDVPMTPTRPTAGGRAAHDDARPGGGPGNPPDRLPHDEANAPFQVAVVAGPWGPIHVAATRRAIVGIAVSSPREPFVSDVVRRTGRDESSGATYALVDRAVAAIAAFLDGDPAGIEDLPLDLADRGLWDRNVLGGVRTLPWGQVTSYGRLARSIGRRGAARAVGGAIGRNPIGLAIPCHRVIAGDGSIGGYGGDWFGSRDTLLAIKRELLAMEGISLPASSLRD